jgi:hypothetical protein
MTKISEVVLMRTGQTIKIEGEKGEKGTTFTPSVSEDGTLSWTNDGGKPNPDPVVIKGDKGDTVIIGDEQEYTLYNSEGDNTDGAMTQAAVTRKFKALDETYARTDGYYETMGVGMATNLKGQNVVDAEFTYRKSGGNVEVQDGNAMIEAIKGNTIAWNQEVPTVSATITGFGSSFIYNEFGKFDLIVGHKYIVLTRPITDGRFIGFYKSPQSEGKYFVLYFTQSTIFTFSGNNVESGKYWLWGNFTSGSTHDININLFDLTLIYGSGNEPATVEQFEQDYFNWFGKPLTYEPYDAGSLRNTKVSALKTVGFNQWDEEWEVGRVESDGTIYPAQSRMTTSLIKVISGASYYIPTNCLGGRYCWYDANMNVIGYSVDGFRVNINTSPTGSSYLRITPPTAYGNTYNHDICINISDPNRNGEYEPYKESTLPLDVTTLTGKLNGEGSSVVVFADGMNSAGNVHDEIKIENGVVKAIKRVGKVDLGDLSGGYYDNKGHYYLATSMTGYKNKSLNMVVPFGGTTTGQAIYDGAFGVGARNDTGVNISHPSNPTTLESFKATVQGVMLYYELAEPEVYVLDDFSLPKLYPVANGGTEEQLSNSPNSLPATLSIRYGLNAAAFIQNAPKNYISKESMTNFLGNLGSVMGGTWSMTWNSSTNKYDFSFTQNRSVDVEQPIEDK